MAQFSGAVKIGDLNDFIAPSQACVVSLQGQTANPQAAVKTPPQAAEGLQLNARPSKRHHQQQQQQQQQQQPQNGITADNGSAVSQQQQQQQQQGGFQQTVLSGDNQAVKVSLNDCLACSGCVTSAETVLLQAQSLKEFVSRCEDADSIVVVSISPQSRASLAALHGISPEDVHAKVAHFLKHQLSVSLVLDISLGQAVALTESAAEFIHRFTQAGGLAAAGAVNGSSGVTSSSSSSSSAGGQLPMLASACPGWVCYAEKTHGSYILPHIATTRSPQGIMGSLVKQRLAAAKGWDPERVYHVTVMPCYDKKLEASRDDFLVPGTSIAEVDSSLTTGELQELLDKYGMGDLKALPTGRGDNLLSLLMAATQQQQQQQQQEPEPLRVPEPLMHAQLGSSGGYADFIFAAAAAELYGTDIAAAVAAAAGGGNGDLSHNSSSSSTSKLPWKVLRNADMQELQLLDSTGRPLLRFAIAYGFRNIQTIVRQIKMGRCQYDYVEVMACPSGCLNGGGQLKAPKGVTSAALVEQLERQYFRQQAAAGGGSQQQQQQQGEDSTAAAADAVQQRYMVEPGSIQLLQPVGTLSSSASSPQQQQQGAAAAASAVPSCISSESLAAVYSIVLGGQHPGAAGLQELLHTQYHKREKTVTSTLSDW